MSEFNEQILEEASLWFVEFREGHLTGESHDAFMHWLKRSPDHIRAYLEVSRLYVELPGGGIVPPAETGRLMEKARARLNSEVVQLPTCAPRLSPFELPRRQSLWRRPRSLAAALVVVLTVAAAFGVFFSQRGLYTTAAGEARTVTLPDGSRIELNGRTRLRVAYSNNQRDVQLFEGQALFHVARDKVKPFIVTSGAAQIRAVGTAFDVNRTGSGITVTVLEGAVAVLSRDAPAVFESPPGSADLVIAAGEQAVITPGGSRKPRATNVSAATAWTRGQLEFDETPLSQVAEEFNRGSPRPLVLESPNLSDLRISGIYSSVDPASLILFLRNQPDLEVTETDREVDVRTQPK